MAQTTVKLEVNGFEKREVTFVSMKFDRKTDDENKPTGVPRGGKIVVRVKALTDTGNADLMHWAVNPEEGKKGKIIFMNPETPTKEMKTLSFEDAYCVNYEEQWEDQIGHYEEITIACKKIEHKQGVKFENSWQRKA